MAKPPKKKKPVIEVKLTPRQAKVATERRQQAMVPGIARRYQRVDMEPATGGKYKTR